MSDRNWRTGTVGWAVTMALAAVVVIYVVALGGAVNAQGIDGEKSITVTGEGQASATSETYIVRLSVTKATKDVSKAREYVASNSSKMMNALSEIGVGEDQIQTTEYNIYEDENDVPSKYATHQFVIKVKSREMAGKVIETAIDNGATGIDGINLQLTDKTRKKLKKKAIEKAMSNARTKAEEIAKHSNLEVTGVYSVVTTDVNQGGQPFEVSFKAGDGGSTDIQAGPLTVTTKVRVTYNATSR